MHKPRLWACLESYECKHWLGLVRGDIASGNEEMMAACC